LKLFHWQIWQGSLQQGSHLARIPIETLATFAIARSLNWARWQRKGKKKDSVYTPLGLRTAASALYDSNIFTHSCQNKMRSQQIRKSWGNMEKSLMNGGFNGKTIHQYIICIYIYYKVIWICFSSCMNILFHYQRLTSEHEIRDLTDFIDWLMVGNSKLKTMQLYSWMGYKPGRERENKAWAFNLSRKKVVNGQQNIM
jgi:hypothetical protein